MYGIFLYPRTFAKFVMSVDDTNTDRVPTTDMPRAGRSASYLPCRHCGEGSLVYDEDRATSVCRCCGAIDG